MSKTPTETRLGICNEHFGQYREVSRECIAIICIGAGKRLLDLPSSGLEDSRQVRAFK